MTPRIPIMRALRRSPFDGLLAHATKVKECVEALKEAIVNYVEGDYEKAERSSIVVSNTEHEADLIKGNIRAHLPRNLLMPVDKSDFLMLLREQDAILDFAEDAILWLDMRKTVIPEEIKKPFLDHFFKVLECVRTLEQVVMNVKEIISYGLRKDLREKIKQTIKDVHKKEWEADNIEREVAKKIFAMNLDAVSVFHLLKAVDLIGDIANHAENAGDRVRAMLAR